jgi:hypothetical protein
LGFAGPVPVATLVVPIVNLIGYWFYALTLPREQDELAFA